MCVFVTKSFDQDKEEFEIVVASDLHYLYPEYFKDYSLFHESLAYGDGKMTDVCDKIMDNFIEEMKEKKPDLVLISGDLTFNGEKASHEALAKMFRQLEKEDIAVAVIDGNHDINNWFSVKYTDSQRSSQESVYKEEFKKIYKNAGYQYAKSEDEASLSYRLDLNAKYSLIILDTCANIYGSSSYISDETMFWLENELQEITHSNKIPLLSMHHNLGKHSELLYEGYTLSNQEEMLALLNKYQVPLVLSGHIHLQNIAEVNGIYDIATSSLAISPMQYGILTLKNESIDYETQKLNMNIDDEAFFEEVYANKIQERLLDIFDEQTASEIGKFLGKVNRYYFSGIIDKHYEEIVNDPLYALVMEHRDDLEFSAVYLESQLHQPNNDLELHIDLATQ